MGTVIYSTSPIGAFMTTFLAVGVLLVLGVVGLAWAVFNRRQGKGTRIGAGIASLFLCGIGALVLGLTLVNLMTSTQTATVLLKHKTVAQDNCGDNGETCARYVLETTAGAKSYDFSVPQEAFKGVQQGGCYQISYYPNGGLFGASSGSDQYVATSHVSLIVEEAPRSCQ